MHKKSSIRRKYFLKRKKQYFKVDENFFTPVVRLLKKQNFNKKLNISIYYPVYYEIDILKILDVEYFKKCNFFLPKIDENNIMNFYKWKKNDILSLNKYGVPEPLNTKKLIPDLVFIPLLAFDKKKNRLGYGKGFYDKYLNKISKLKKKFLSIGVAFYFQKYNKLPINNKDFKLNYIITEKGIL
tara:strand:+ start:518 stop:1069 length:552 start_codon:yes stop_codon:yes gene_type:complete